MEMLLHSASTLKHSSGTQNPKETFTSPQRDGSSLGLRRRPENLTCHFQGPYIGFKSQCDLHYLTLKS